MSDELVPLNAPATPEQPLEEGYYTCVEKTGDFLAGEMGYLLEDDGRARITLLYGEKQFWFDRAAFIANFTFEPDGAARRLAETARLQAESRAAVAALKSFNPHISAEGDPTGLALTAGTSPDAAKRSVAEVRNEAGRLRRDLETRTAAIKAFAEEQAIILRKQASELAEILQKAEEAVWTINLYLGQDEEIVQLSQGAPAPADTPITIRQLVLFMDEESAVAAEEGGLDARNIDAFDAWLMATPAHLDQLIPEQKGMVACKPRRKKRDYGDPWVDAELNRLNRKTYLLIRNGANVYRIWISYEVGEHLVPKTDEFLSFFTDRVWNEATHSYERVPVKPGSDAFMRAEKQAAAQKRHYMRAALILQGLIDRTTVFAPMASKINVGDEKSYEHDLNVVLDADAMLTDGRERFTDWFRRINSEIGIGIRIIGTFNSYEHGLRNYDGERSGRNERLSPPTAAKPSDNTLYTLEEKRGHGFAFYYERTGEWQTYEKRAVCTVEPSDRFILNFDAATVDEMEFYLSSRLDRQAYSYLFPTLKMAIRLKRKEEEAEAPIRLLLAGQIALAHGVSVAEAEASVPELIRWWKFKNRTHRALTSDDAKAIRMIVAEFGHRAEQATVRDKRTDEAAAMLTRILAAEPGALLVAHKAGAEYVALIPANDEDIFVHEQTWTAKSGLRSTAEWHTIDSRPQRWQILHTSARYADWKIGASRLEHLTDAERLSVAEQGWTKLETARRHYRSLTEPKIRLTTCVRADGTIELYYTEPTKPLPTELFLTSALDEPRLHRTSVNWRRDASRAPIVESIDPPQTLSTGGELPWVKTYDGNPYKGTVLVEDRAALATFRENLSAFGAVMRERRRLEGAVGTAFDGYQRTHLAALEAEAYAKFLSDYGDPDLWEGHRKGLKLPTHLDAKDLRIALTPLIERGIAFEALTAGEVIDRANAIRAEQGPLKGTDDHGWGTPRSGRLTALRIEEAYRDLVWTPRPPKAGESR